MNKLAICVFTFTISTMATAALNDQVNDWFSDQEYANVTPAGSFKTQQGRMYTGGGISYRTGTEPVFHFVDVQMPKISAGCGGIDAYAGGFSFINDDKFKESVRAIGQNAGGLLMMLAVKTASPVLEDLMSKFKSYADKFNQFQTDSCKAASSILEFGAKKLGFTENCIQLRMETKGEARVEAEYKCNGREGVPTPDPGKPVNRAAFTEGNLAWHVLMSQPTFQNDLELAQLVMNISGTVVIDKPASKEDFPKIRAMQKPLIGNNMGSNQFNNIFNALFLGNRSAEPLELFTCDPSTLSNSQDGCRVITPVKKISPNWMGMNEKVNLILTSISQKIESGQGSFTKEEIGLIESTSMPIYRYLSAATASQTFNLVGSDNPASAYGSIIASDIIYRNLRNLIEKMQYAVDNDKQNLSASPEFVEFSKGLSEVRTGLSQKIQENESFAQQTSIMVDQIRDYERQILPRVAKSYLDAAKF